MANPFLISLSALESWLMTPILERQLLPWLFVLILGKLFLPQGLYGI